MKRIYSDIKQPEVCGHERHFYSMEDLLRGKETRGKSWQQEDRSSAAAEVMGLYAAAREASDRCSTV